MFLSPVILKKKLSFQNYAHWVEFKVPKIRIWIHLMFCDKVREGVIMLGELSCIIYYGPS